LLRITNPVSDLNADRGPVVLCDFFEVAILEIAKIFVWEILPIQPTIQTGGKISTPSFSI
jgi:hypothetical protein